MIKIEKADFTATKISGISGGYPVQRKGYVKVYFRSEHEEEEFKSSGTILLTHKKYYELGEKIAGYIANRLVNDEEIGIPK